MQNKFFIETYGCQMNVAESHALEKKLHEAGWTEALSGEEADLVVLNTCSVRKTAENRIWGRLGFYKTVKKDHDFLLGVMGCMTQRLEKEIRTEAPAVDILIGTFGKDDFGRTLKTGALKSGMDFFGESEYKFAEEHGGDGEFQAMIPIMHGCNNFCSYCIVPYVRGREVSRNPDEIIKELKKLEEEGIKEITLLGQNVNSYCYSENSGGELNFAGLIKRVAAETEIPWIRFMSSHPKDLTEELIKVIAANPRICRHIHLPVQHGSSNILAAMNRKYTREDYLSLVGRMRKAIPYLSLTTDLMMGFPGETEDDVRLTRELMEEVGFDDAFTYQYNAIENTVAFDLEDQIDPEEKGRRLAGIIELQRSISAERKKKYVGREVNLLVEKVSRKSSEELLGRTENNHMVVFKGGHELIGSMVRVRIEKLAGNTFTGVNICRGD